MTSQASDAEADRPADEPPPRPRTVVFGEVLYDHFPDGSRVLGGAPFNVAWHLCGFGEDPLVISAVGTDDEGRDVLDQMEGWGLAAEGIQEVEEFPTGRVEVRTDAADGPSFRIPEDQAWDHIRTRPALDAVDPERVPLLYHGSLAARSRESRDTLDALLEATRAPAFVDLNLRAPWWDGDVIRWCLSHANWLKLNAEELAEVTGREVGSAEACRDAARALSADHDVPNVIVTRGSEGALLVTDAGDFVERPAPGVEDLVDTVGGGDAFSAVLCHAIRHGWDEATAMERAVNFAADLCRVQGATHADLERYDRHVERWQGEPAAGDAPGTGRAPGLYVLSLSVHGLVRGEDIELGRDADTGGQVSYVVDQARSLAAHPGVDRVDLVTRQVFGRQIDESYAEPTEPLSDGARIIRLPFGPRRYLRKESLWPHLDSLLDQLTRHIRTQHRIPDIIHGHYADAGYVGAQLAKLLGVPFVFTGHSLGRVKRARLLADGADEGELEERYRITRRIEAEEQALETAALVIASTRQEVREQYESYDHYQPDRMEVIPPGVDLSRFSPPSRFWARPRISRELERFLRNPYQPMVLAVARADERKNFRGLIEAFAGTEGLRDRANLVLIAGNRDDIREMAPAPRRVLDEILHLIDKHDLYGSVAYPKRHRPDDIPDVYRLAASTRGVFVNPALTEPFGLTLIEAAASGLPIVATNDGGPRDIIDVLENGVLVDPLDHEAMGRAILEALDDSGRWSEWSRNGSVRVDEHFSWRAHVDHYLGELEDTLTGTRPVAVRRKPFRLVGMDRMLVTDVDNTLTGDSKAMAALAETLEEAGAMLGFGIASGRTLEEAMALLDELDIRTPDVLITGSGTQIHYGGRLVRDRSWERQIRYEWKAEAVHDVLEGIPDLVRAGEVHQTPYRLRYVVDGPDAPDATELHRRLRQADLRVNVIPDHGMTLDIVPVRASPGLAIRFICFKWDLPPEHLLVAGDSGNDVDMLSGETLGVVVGNHTDELEDLRGHSRVYFADRSHAGGIIQGLDWYDFLGDIRIPEEQHPEGAPS